MKITQIRTNKNNQQSVKTLEMSNVLETMKDDTQYADVRDLRYFMKWADRLSEYKNMYRLPVYYPSVELSVNRDGQRRLRRFTGLLTLTMAPLHDRDELPVIKEALRQLPMTVAAFLGSSGRTVKVVVRIAAYDGTLPQDEQGARRLCQQAYPLLCRLYQTVVNMAPVSAPLTVNAARRKGEDSVLMAGFRRTVDDQPLLVAEAAPMFISTRLPLNTVAPVPDVATLPAADTTETAADASVAATVPATPAERVSQEMTQFIELLSGRYDFRRNIIMGYVEYRSKEDPYYGWRPVDEPVYNGMAVQARLKGLNVWDKDVVRYLRSDMIRRYNPIDEYLWDVRDKWDGHDHIGDLARRVPTSQKQWPRWFRMWFLAMVAQWLHRNPRYGNAMAPLLISTQGYNKSTFCRMLIPPELKWGYNDNLMLSEKKAVLQAMSQFLLINLDEFNQISPKVQEGFLKNLIQLASVKVKPPYGRHVVEQPRLASFIATTNVNDILSDPSGNRRFFGIELRGPIDVTTPLNYRQLYAQAVKLLDDGERYWLDEEQTLEVMRSNEQFQMRSPEQIYFDECFRIVASEAEGQWFSAAAVFDVIKRRAGAALRGGNLIRFSRILANVPNIVRHRTSRGVEYLLAHRS